MREPTRHTRIRRAAAVLTSAALMVTGLVTAPAATADDEPAPLATHSVTWTGESGASFGSDISGSCDVTGDGIDDLIVGSRNWFGNGWDRGAAYVLVGGPSITGGDVSDPAAAGTIRIDGTDRWLGSSVACAGDVNKDGIEDFVVGNNSRSHYQVAVVFGSRDLSSLKMDNLGDQGFLIQDPVAGTDDLDNFGYWVGAAGDMNGDGYADIAVGDLLADNNGLSNSGSVWIIAGAAGADDVNVQSDSDRVITRIDGQNAQERLSNAEIAGDVNGDGADDLLLSSYVGTPWGSGSPAAGAGYIVFGGDNAPLHLSTDLGERGFAIAGPQRGRDRLGVSSAPLGDINGDRIADLVIGAYGVSYPDAPRNGGAAVVLGAKSNAPVITDPTGDPSVYSCADGAFDADCTGSTKISRGYWINGPSDNSGAGSWVSGLGDLNGDSRPDVGIGAVGIDQVFAVYSEPSRTATLELADLTTAQGEVFTDTYNSVIGEAGDFDGNGIDDFIISGTNAVSVVLRGALRTGLEATGDEAAAVGDTVELTVTARSLLPSAQPEFAGTVRATVDGEPVGESHEVRPGGGPISIEVPATRLGATTVAVEFAPDDPNLFQPASAEHTIEVGLRDDGAGALALDRTSAAYGDPVNAEFSTSQELTGEVEFRAGERVLGTAAVAGGAAAAELAPLDPGGYEIVAHYLGDDVYGAFSTTAERLEITRSATSIGAPTLSKSRAVYGSGAVTASVRVIGADGGTVTFTDNGRTLQRVPVSASGTATARLAKPTAGTHSIRARYDGSDTHAASALSATAELTVSKAKPTSVSVSGKRFKKGTTPRVAVRVGKLDNGSYPVGKVRVQVGSVKKTVSLSAAKKGRVTVKLTKKYRKSFSVRATFLPKDAKNVAKATSKKSKVRAR